MAEKPLVERGINSRYNERNFLRYPDRLVVLGRSIYESPFMWMIGAPFSCYNRTARPALIEDECFLMRSRSRGGFERVEYEIEFTSELRVNYEPELLVLVTRWNLVWNCLSILYTGHVKFRALRPCIYWMRTITGSGHAMVPDLRSSRRSASLPGDLLWEAFTKYTRLLAIGTSWPLFYKLRSALAFYHIFHFPLLSPWTSKGH
jgi:hypothetical protein